MLEYLAVGVAILVVLIGLKLAEERDNPYIIIDFVFGLSYTY